MQNNLTAGARRTKSSTARQVSDAIEWTEVLLRESVQYFICQLGNIIGYLNNTLIYSPLIGSKQKLKQLNVL